MTGLTGKTGRESGIREPYCGPSWQCNTRRRLLPLLYDIEAMWRKTIQHAFSIFYTLIIKHGFLTNQNARWVLSMLWTTNVSARPQFVAQHVSITIYVLHLDKIKCFLPLLKVQILHAYTTKRIVLLILFYTHAGRLFVIYSLAFLFITSSTNLSMKLVLFYP